MSKRRSKDEEKEDGINWFGIAATAIGAVVAMGVGFFLGQQAERESVRTNPITTSSSSPRIVELDADGNEMKCSTSYTPPHVTRTQSYQVNTGGGTTTTTTMDGIEDDEDHRDEHLCKICYEQHLDAVLLPCRHQIACDSCSRSIQHCPVCRATITQVLAVYRS